MGMCEEVKTNNFIKLRNFSMGLASPKRTFHSISREPGEDGFKQGNIR